MENYKLFQLITACLESFMAIPILGGIFVIGFLWTPLILALALHITTLVLCSKKGGRVKKSGSVLGIITSVVAFIPIVGWVMHVIAAIVLWLNFNNNP